MVKSYIFIILGIIFVLILAALVFFGFKALSNAGIDNNPEQMACTLDAKICPDGSAVGRNPNNNCEFDACPSQNSEELYCPQDTKQCADGSFVTRNPGNRCQFDECPSEGTQVACTLEVILCPNGSYVGRDPENNCEFQACPVI